MNLKQTTILALIITLFWGIVALASHGKPPLFNPEMPQESIFSDEAISDAIYKAEGAEKAKKPFGILSVKCEGYNECRKICLNTIKNNRVRYTDYGHKQYDTYLEFLASRYAPINAKNDSQGLNKYWLKNVKYFLYEKT